MTRGGETLDTMSSTAPASNGHDREEVIASVGGQRFVADAQRLRTRRRGGKTAGRSREDKAWQVNSVSLSRQSKCHAGIGCLNSASIWHNSMPHDRITPPYGILTQLESQRVFVVANPSVTRV
jgi:hypothetical protein